MSHQNQLHRTHYAFAPRQTGRSSGAPVFESLEPRELLSAADPLLGIDAEAGSAPVIEAPAGGGASPDVTAPSADLLATDITQPGPATYDFQVTFADNEAVDVTTLNGNDVVVTGPNGYAQYGRLTGVEDNPADQPIPKLEKWQQQMLTFGEKHGDTSKAYTTWEGHPWYYDGQWAFYQMADYTGDSSWNKAAQHIENTYRTYVLDNNGAVPGWRVFPHGLYEDYLRTGDKDSKRAVLLLAEKSTFAYSAGGEAFTRSRETAYIMQAYMYAEKLGANPNPKLATALEYALGHIDQWVVSKTAAYVQPFMMGLTAHALMEYDEMYGDDRIQPALTQLADWLWDNAWRQGRQAFYYQSNSHMGAPVTAYNDTVLDSKYKFFRFSAMNAEDGAAFSEGMLIQQQGGGWTAHVIPGADPQRPTYVHAEVLSGSPEDGDAFENAEQTISGSILHVSALDWRFNNQGSPDVNMLIAPMFAWLFNQTGDAKYITRGDAVFAGGVKGAYLHGGKQFVQSYRLSFTYLTLRQAARSKGSSPRVADLASATTSVSQTATYRVTTPGGAWDEADNGTYTISLMPGQVSDTSANFTPSATLGSFDVAIGSEPVALNRFGNFEGRTGVSLTLPTSNGSFVTLSLKGGGYGVVEGESGIDSIVLIGTISRSTLKVTSKAKAPEVGDITVNGSIRSLRLKGINLAGDIDVSGTLGSLMANHVVGPGTITIGSASANGSAVTLRMNHVRDMTVDSAMPIRNLIVTGWTNTDGLEDTVTAPSIGKLQVRTAKRGTPVARSGAFEADLALTGSGTVLGGV